VINAIQRAIDLKSTYNIRVINLSLGRPVMASYLTDPLNLAVEAAWNAGITVVVAAGNEGRNNSQNTNGYATIGAPGNDPFVITVGAMKTSTTGTRNDDLMASYSSKGPSLLDHIAKPDVVAPGNRVVSLYHSGETLSSTYPGNVMPYSYYQTAGSSSPSTSYMQLSGTSMATPVVAGAAALLVSSDSTLTPDMIKAKLMKTATKTFPTSSTTTDPDTGAVYTTYYDLFTVGAGYIDIAAALANTDRPTGLAISPTASVDASGHVTLSNGDTPLNGNTVVWGTDAGNGDPGFTLVWGTSTIWGTSTVTSPESTRATVKGEK